MNGMVPAMSTALLPESSRTPEVQHLNPHLPVRADLQADVFRLDVSVRHPFLVDVAKPARDLTAKLRDLIHLEPALPFLEHLEQVLGPRQFHANEDVVWAMASRMELDYVVVPHAAHDLDLSPQIANGTCIPQKGLQDGLHSLP
eukprot:CAMPEP_0204137622 /NCGR_PEP_ID=MMETSP0361-20130328/17510_1 /ASSEMBLY_ACC=CAM_ASM_000343 /TAXON_ID=268821 /ORGANISM="Scrippsiella Hangoei, Strain SHTV-5" /LENGTH=143 /DNA_ID=CAMNT_0051091315 /DNA_START=363 /DNA_END=790 /DNA_ORIENTATION=-